MDTDTRVCCQLRSLPIDKKPTTGFNTVVLPSTPPKQHSAFPIRNCPQQIDTMSDNGNNQLALPDSVVVLLVILGAAASVCLGYAVQRNFSKADYQDDNFNKKPVNQMDYMREVRSRNQMAAFADARPQRYPRPEV
ncbi:hypothetical protein LTR92_003328 [Exophiala xenobiotica]|nr:hypothetical protein LTR92_003328 [Exophiala xenobiotica]KAK5246115.1 hypothetical protein LTS06_008520 [Exophiala xenobiotica]KAK5411147.1 hypothetical protein LTR06_006037 [Exophiala xenobiotica]